MKSCLVGFNGFLKCFVLFVGLERGNLISN